MARRPRDDAPGAAHHVMLRGIERRAIFRDEADRRDFLSRLSRLVPELGFRCFAWALMPNHVHLVVRSGPARISRLMARLGTGYARRFNERHDRVGHLFQNRFRSRLLEDDADLMGVVLYVLRNPLADGLVANGHALERYRWVGLGALLGSRAAQPFEAISETLELFGPNPATARQRLRERLEAPASSEALVPVRLRRPSLERAGGFEDFLRGVCARHSLAPSDVRSRRQTQRIVAARREVAVWAARELGLSGAEIARRLGVTTAAVSWMLRGECRRNVDVLTF